MADAEKIPFPKDGYIDKDTGMYTVDGPKANESEFVETGVAGSDKTIFVPRPTHKPIRMIQFATPHAYLEVSETLEQVREMIDKAKQENSPAWFSFIEPSYGTLLAVHRDQLRGACWVMEGWKDMDAVRLQREQADLAIRQAKFDMARMKRGSH